MAVVRLHVFAISSSFWVSDSSSESSAACRSASFSWGFQHLSSKAAAASASGARRFERCGRMPTVDRLGHLKVRAADGALLDHVLLILAAALAAHLVGARAWEALCRLLVAAHSSAVCEISVPPLRSANEVAAINSSCFSLSVPFAKYATQSSRPTGSSPSSAAASPAVGLRFGSATATLATTSTASSSITVLGEFSAAGISSVAAGISSMGTAPCHWPSLT
eukprot:CAMPEP_0174719550 /NCGR_PEP_ID=MMETSP1094-20130205/31377_1 /TAXON_ID=156173 /ORGANISM="Chrysochromulina brevifilum, Strain UTEX LB 985" /LENGTH=221 /DNA_ID=CAMNT_0015919863 /DNA_START=440 /DNA_END=1108 /DNA_ORIENTATION=+